MDTTPADDLSVSSRTAVIKSSPSKAIFSTVVKFLYNDPNFKNALTTDEAIILYGYYMQATKGQNDEWRPSCIVFLLSGGLEDRKWQVWKNLGSMSKEEAAKNFLAEIMKINPDFMNIVIEPQKVSLRAMVQHDAAIKIQGLLRKVRGKKMLIQMVALQRSRDLQEFIEMLQKGIKVLKLRGDGSVTRKRFLALKLGASLLDSRLFTFASGYSRDATSTGAYIVDIAEVRLGSQSFMFRPIASSLNSSECMSIICSERTFDIQVGNYGTDIINSNTRIQVN
jgi:acyl-CoA-binding protein